MGFICINSVSDTDLIIDLGHFSLWELLSNDPENEK